MPVKVWGSRKIVDLEWQGPKLFSLNRTPRTVPDYRGVYLLCSRKETNEYRPRPVQSCLHRLREGRGPPSAHVSRNPRVQTVLSNEGTMWFWYARVTQGIHDCVEQILFDDFVARHGENPVLNVVRPPCALDWTNVTVRHHKLSFPYDFSRRDFP